MARFIDTRLNNFSLPGIVHKDKDYYIELDKYLGRYFNHVKTIEGLDGKCLSNTEENIELILKSLALYNNAKIGDAKECIKKIIEKYCDNPWIVANIDNNYAFRGVAPKDIQPKLYKKNPYYEKMNKQPLSFFKARVAVESINRRDMLHIPFDKRGLISTQRFSISGVPCLYLGTTSLGCWLEVNMPQLELFQVASYKIPNDLKILNMCISQHFINGSTNGGWVDDEEFNDVCSLIELFPLVCATSFQVLEMNRSFKSEYIISQLIMQVVNELEIDGVAYLSKKMKDIYAYPQAVNLAIQIPSEKIPPYEDSTLDMYWKRSNEVLLTDAFKCSDILEKDHKPPYLSYVNEIYSSGNFNEFVLLNGDKINYMETIFSKFDEFLVTNQHYNFR